MLFMVEMKTKLSNFGPVVAISLDAESRRREHLISQFEDYGITDYRIMSAYDGRQEGLTAYKMSSGEIGCSISHLKAIRDWYENDLESPYLIVCEDDLSLDTVDLWRWSWDEFMQNAPKDFDIIHLSPPPFTEHEVLDLKLRKIDKNNTPLLTTIYVISRLGAKKVLDGRIVSGEVLIDYNNRDNVADYKLLYGTVDNGYHISLFAADPRFESSIEGHTDQYFYDSVKGVTTNLLEKSELSIQEILKL